MQHEYTTPREETPRESLTPQQREQVLKTLGKAGLEESEISQLSEALLQYVGGLERRVRSLENDTRRLRGQRDALRSTLMREMGGNDPMRNYTSSELPALTDKDLPSMRPDNVRAR